MPISHFNKQNVDIVTLGKCTKYAYSIRCLMCEPYGEDKHKRNKTGLFDSADQIKR